MIARRSGIDPLAQKTSSLARERNEGAMGLSRSATQPLKGLRVLELAQVMAGPVTGLMLADLGADVVKVEKLGVGDDARGFRDASAHDDVSAPFQVLNRGKRSIAVDLKHPAGREALSRLVTRADVLTENFRPGTMDKLGVGPEQLIAINPRLVYCSITGYGRKGPLSMRGGFDLILQAFSGLIDVTGEPGRGPVKPGVPIADVNAGILGAMAVLAGYIHVLQTGRGQHVETSLLQASMQPLYWYAALYFSGVRAPSRLGTAHPVIAPYQTFMCADGEIAIGGANESNWHRISEVVGRPELRTDPRFRTAQQRLSNREALAQLLTDALACRTRREWEEAFTAAGVPAGPVQTFEEAFAHPQTQEMDVLVRASTPDGGVRPMIGLPIHFSGRNSPALAAAPRLGQHTVEVLLEFGFSREEIDALCADGCIAQHRDRHRSVRRRQRT